MDACASGYIDTVQYTDMVIFCQYDMFGSELIRESIRGCLLRVGTFIARARGGMLLTVNKKISVAFSFSFPYPSGTVRNTKNNGGKEMKQISEETRERIDHLEAAANALGAAIDLIIEAAEATLDTEESESPARRAAEAYVKVDAIADLSNRAIAHLRN